MILLYVARGQNGQLRTLCGWEESSVGILLLPARKVIARDWPGARSRRDSMLGKAAAAQVNVYPANLVPTRVIYTHYLKQSFHYTYFQQDQIFSTSCSDPNFPAAHRGMYRNRFN
jgi:hypothetical protein